MVLPETQTATFLDLMQNRIGPIKGKPLVLSRCFTDGPGLIADVKIGLNLRVQRMQARLT
jgi:hypothetical protein